MKNALSRSRAHYLTVFSLGFGLLASPGAFGETVNINGAFSGIAYGNSSNGGITRNLPSSNNTLNISDSVSGSAYGGFHSAAGEDATGNTVNISGTGSVGGAVSGGVTRSGNATNNTVNISGTGSVGGLVHAGFAIGGGDATGNTVNISGTGSVGGAVSGGFTTYSGNATNNTVNISGTGSVGGLVHVGFATGSGDATGNTLNISGGTVGSIHVGYGVNATGNTLNISGGTVRGSVEVGGAGIGGNATNNTVTISGNPTFGAITMLYGGLGGVDHWTGNTLNLKTPIRVSGVYNFQFYNFYLPATMTAGQTMLAAGSAVDIRGSTIRVGIDGDASALKPGDQVILISSSVVLSADASLNGSRAQGIQGIARIYDFTLSTDARNLYAKAGEARGNEQLKALSEGRLAGLAFLLEGADLLWSPGMYGNLPGTQRQELGLMPFGATIGGSSKYDTGSHIDVDGFHLLAGLVWRAAPWEFGALALGGFFEAGWGNYTSHNSFDSLPSVKGRGDTSYYGGGVMGRFDLPVGPGGAYVDASVRIGHVDMDFRTNDILNASSDRTRYDSGSAYYGLHTGAGYIWNINPKATLDMTTKLIWTSMDGDSVTISGDKIKFKKVDSQRWRTGGRFSYAVNEHVSPYVGAYYDHEFSGKAKATANGDAIKAPKLTGGTGVGELGVTLKPSKTQHLSIDLGVQGYAGRREGVSGSVRAKLEF